MNPRLAHTQVILLHEHWHTFHILHSLFPRCSPPILRHLFPRCSPPVVLQATVGGGEGLGMRLLSHKWER